MNTHADRRSFLLGGLGLAALARPLCARAQARSEPARTLVLIQLTGGNDGLSTLVPYAHDVYARSRRSTRIEAKDVLRIDARVGLHPSLAGLRELFERGHLALLEGIGYPQPNRSHFRSMDVWQRGDVWQAGDPSGHASAGWIGRSAAELHDVQPLAVVHLGVRAPFSLVAPRCSPVCLSPAFLRAADPDHERALDEARGLEDPAPSANDTLGFVRAVWDQAFDTTAALHAALARASTKVRYPSAPFAQDLRAAAALIHAELGVRVCSLELAGFDTHRDQRGRLARLLAELDAGLTAFAADLAQSAAGREALVIAFSEFGRRVEENASGGTDHGAASVAFALGERVHGGLHGKPPDLERLVDGDLALTTDFRSFYATAIEDVFAVPHEHVLGAHFPRVPYV